MHIIGFLVSRAFQRYVELRIPTNESKVMAIRSLPKFMKNGLIVLPVETLLPVVLPVELQVEHRILHWYHSLPNFGPFLPVVLPVELLKNSFHPFFSSIMHPLHSQTNMLSKGTISTYKTHYYFIRNPKIITHSHSNHGLISCKVSLWKTCSHSRQTSCKSIRQWNLHISIKTFKT